MMDTSESKSQYRWRIRNMLLKSNLPKGVVAYNNGRMQVRAFPVLRPWLTDTNMYYTRDVIYSDSTIRMDAYVRVKRNYHGIEYNFLTVVYSQGTTLKYAIDCEFYYIDTVTGNLWRIWYSDDTGDQVYVNDSNHDWLGKVTDYVYSREEHMRILHSLNDTVKRVSTKIYYNIDDPDKLDHDPSVPNKYMEPKKYKVEDKPRKRYLTKKRILAGETRDGKPANTSTSTNKLPDIL